MTRLILHFDVNETILVGDPAGGDTFEESLNKIVCKSTLVRQQAASESTSNPLFLYSWWDGSPLDLHARRPTCEAPSLFTGWERPPGCESFYDVPELKREYARRFTEPTSPGAIYRPVYEELERALRLPAGVPRVDPRLSHDGVHHYLLPAFFHTLHQLDAQGRDFTVVIRTFGTDGAHVAAAIDAWAEGRHPAVPGVPALRVASAWQGRYDPAGGRFRATRIAVHAAADAAAGPRDRQGPAGAAAHESEHGGGGGGGVKEVVEEEELEEEALVERIESGSERCLLVVDDYEWWRSHGYPLPSLSPIPLSLSLSPSLPLAFPYALSHVLSPSLCHSAVFISLSLSVTFSTPPPPLSLSIFSLSPVSLPFLLAHAQT